MSAASSPSSTSAQRALVVFVRAAVLVALVVVGAQLWTTDLGMGERLVDTTRIVSAVDPGGPAARAGIAVGDEILEDPGLEPNVAERTEREAYAWSYRIGRAMKRGSVPMRIRHRGEERVVTLDVDPGPRISAALRQLERLGSELPVAFAFLGVAFLLSLRPSRSERDERARIDVATSFALLGTSWVGAWPAPAWPLWLYPTTSLLEVFAASSGILFLAKFAWSYPTRSSIVDHRGLRAAILAIGFCCGTFSVLNSLHVVAAPAGLHGNTAHMAFSSALGLATLVGLGWQRRRAADVIARRQATWLLTFCGVGMFVPIALLLVPHYGLGMGAPPIVHILLLAFPLLIPIGFAAVVTRYRLFSLDGVAVHAISYAVAVVTSIIVCLAVTLGLQAAFASQVGMADASRWLGTIAALIVIEPLRRASQILLDRAFARDKGDFLRRCAELASRLAPLSDPLVIAAEIRAGLDAKAVRLVELDEWLDDADLRTVELALGRTGVVRVVDLRDAHVVDRLRDHGFELLVAVPSSRVHDEPISRALALTLPAMNAVAGAERDALALVGRVVGAALARDAAWRLLKTEVSRADHERRQIAMELHDGVGATLTAARSMAHRLRAHANSMEQPTLDALDEALRDGLGDLRQSLAGLDPAEGEWEALVAHVRRHVGDQCGAEGISLTFDSHGEDSTRLSAAGRLTVLRVVQEAVNNAVKHASPSRLRVTMALRESGIDVAVEDDGKGGARTALTAAAGRGLGNMTRRVESLSGELRIDNVVPHGTRVEMTLPASAFVLASAAQSEVS